MLFLPGHIHEEITGHAQDEYPHEACGILAGKGGAVQAFYPMRNIDESSEHFMMDPKEQFAVVKDVRGKGLEVAAIYHSHPFTPARPSAEDIRLALTPGVSYVIVSLADLDKPVLKSFRIKGGLVAPEAVEITGSIKYGQLTQGR